MLKKLRGRAPGCCVATLSQHVASVLMVSSWATRLLVLWPSDPHDTPEEEKGQMGENPGLPTPSAFLNSPMISLLKDFHSLFICQKFVTIMWPYLVAKAAGKCGALYSGSNAPSGELGSLMKREGRVNVAVRKQGPLPPGHPSVSGFGAKTLFVCLTEKIDHVHHRVKGICDPLLFPPKTLSRIKPVIPSPPERGTN